MRKKVFFEAQYAHRYETYTDNPNGFQQSNRGEINKSQYWPRGAPKHAKTAENEKA